MKKTLCLAAVLAVAACAREKKAEAPPAEAPAAAPAPAAGDSMGMQHDSTMARDTSKKM